jgi:hypothetical protein
MDKDKYNDELIEAMLKDSVIEAPEEITAEVVKALPSVRRRRTLFSARFWSRRKMMLAAFIYLTLVIILMILLTISTMRIFQKGLGSRRKPQSVESIDREP